MVMPLSLHKDNDEDGWSKPGTLSNFKPNNSACDKRSESTNGLSVAQDAARNERKPPLITGSKLEKCLTIPK